MHIGLIVGIGPAATDYYYRSLITRMASAEVVRCRGVLPTGHGGRSPGDVEERVSGVRANSLA